MEDVGQEPSEKPDEKHLRTDAHFEPLEAEVLSESLDMLASIICEYIERSGKDE